MYTFCSEPGCGAIVTSGRWPPMRRRRASSVSRYTARSSINGIARNVGRTYATTSYAPNRFARRLTRTACRVLTAEMDHIKKHDGDPRSVLGSRQLQGLCKSCHTQKTIAARKRRNFRRRARRRSTAPTPRTAVLRPAKGNREPALRDQGMSDVAVNAQDDRPRFHQQAVDFVFGSWTDSARRLGEHITDACKRAGIQPHDDRAFGPVYMTLARQKRIEKIGSVRRERGHGTSGGNIWALKGRLGPAIVNLGTGRTNQL